MNTKKGARKTYNAEFIEQLKTKLNEAPEVTKVRELTASEAVKEMAKEIHAMQNRGYTLAMILEMLKANEVDVSLATLKSAIAGTKAKKKATKSKPVQQDLPTGATAPEDETTTRPAVVNTQTAKKSAIFVNEIKPDSTI